ncbi:MAG: hypothetical protein ACPGSM_09595 [Thiolinea sp.]
MTWARESIDVNQETTGADTNVLAITTPAAGEIMVFAMSVDQAINAGSGSFSVADDSAGDSDFTVLQQHDPSDSNGAGGVVAWKEANGDETQITVSFTGGQCKGESVCFTYSGLDASPVDGSAENTTDSGSTVTSNAAPSVTPTAQPGVALHIFMVEESRKWYDTELSASAGTIARFGNNNFRPAVILVEQSVSDLTAKTTTLSTTDTGCEVYSVTLLLKEPGGGSTALSVNDISQSQGIDSVSLTQAHSLAVNDLSQSQSIDSVTLTQAHVITVSDLGQSQALGSTALTQAQILSAAGIQQAQTVDALTLAQAGILSVDHVGQSQLLDATSLTQAGQLSVNDIENSQSIEGATLTVAGSLALQKIAQSQGIEAVTLTQAGVLAVADIAQAQGIDTAQLAQHYQLAIQDVLQGHSLGGVTLSAGGIGITPERVSQSQEIDSVGITEYAVLSVDDLTQAQAIDIAYLGGLVIGTLEGVVSIYALVDGEVTITPLSEAVPGIHELMEGSVTLH